MKKLVCIALIVIAAIGMFMIYREVDTKIAVINNTPEHGLNPETIWEHAGHTNEMLDFMKKKINNRADEMFISKVRISTNYGLKNIEPISDFGDVMNPWITFYQNKDNKVSNFRANKKFWILIIHPPQGEYDGPIWELEDDQKKELDERMTEMHNELAKWTITPEEAKKLDWKYGPSGRKAVQSLKSKIGVLNVVNMIWRWHTDFCDVHAGQIEAWGPLISPQSEWIMEYVNYFVEKNPEVLRAMKYRILIPGLLKTLALVVIAGIAWIHFFSTSIWKEVQAYSAEKKINPFRAYFLIWKDYWFTITFWPPNEEGVIKKAMNETLTPLIKMARVEKIEEEARYFWMENQEKIQKHPSRSGLEGLYKKAMDQEAEVETRTDALASLKNTLLKETNGHTAAPLAKLPKKEKKGGGGGFSLQHKPHEKPSIIGKTTRPLILMPQPDEEDIDDAQLFNPEEKIFFLGAGYTIKQNIKERLLGIVKLQGADSEKCAFFDADQSQDMKAIQRRQCHWYIILTQVMGHSKSDAIKATAVKNGKNIENVIEIDDIGEKKFRKELAIKIKIARAQIAGKKGGKKKSNGNGH